MEGRVIILDFGSQYTQLIARRVREHKVYGEIIPYNKPFELSLDIKALILSGSPFSVLDPNALQFGLEKVIGKIPILAVCYGAQYTAHVLGGKVAASNKREYGKASLSKIHHDDILLNGISPNSQVWMSHGDTIIEIPPQFDLIAGTDSIDVAVFRSKPTIYPQPIYCLQFHPEVAHSLDGRQILSNFLFKVAACEANWTPISFIEETVSALKKQIGTEHVLMGLSGGVDSTVAAVLLQKAIGDQLTCFFVDNGLLRQDEFEKVLNSYENMGLKIVGINAREKFWKALEGVSDPEQKRKVIGRVFIEVFEAEATKFPSIKWLGQGTIYPDVIESVSVHGPSVTIKSHHNVGGLPEVLKLKIVEPLRSLFKDEVREVGKQLGIQSNILNRHPFPGPGLGIRILGAITPEKVKLLQHADDIFIRKLQEYQLYDEVWQAGCILLPVRSVGVMGDERTYEFTVALRAVNSTDGMTAEWSKLPHDFLAEVSSAIINKVKGINRVVYDISTKPPSTIEWE